MSKTYRVNLDQHDNFLFRLDFGDAGVIYSDEPEPLGKGEGPSPSQMLAASVANCLAASLLFALRKKKLDPNHIEANVSGAMERDDNNRLRIKTMTVEIIVDGDLTSELAQQALSVFEDFCIVTQSVRDGIDVSVNVVEKS